MCSKFLFVKMCVDHCLWDVMCSVCRSSKIRAICLVSKMCDDHWIDLIIVRVGFRWSIGPTHRWPWIGRTHWNDWSDRRIVDLDRSCKHIDMIDRVDVSSNCTGHANTLKWWIGSKYRRFVQVMPNRSCISMCWNGSCISMWWNRSCISMCWNGSCTSMCWMSQMSLIMPLIMYACWCDHP